MRRAGCCPSRGPANGANFVVRSLKPVLHETRAVHLNFVDELDVCRAPPARHQGRRRRAAVLVADDDAVADPPATIAPVVLDVEHEWCIARRADGVGPDAQRWRVGEDDAVGRTCRHHAWRYSRDTETLWPSPERRPLQRHPVRAGRERPDQGVIGRPAGAGRHQDGLLLLAIDKHHERADGGDVARRTVVDLDFEHDVIACACR